MPERDQVIYDIERCICHVPDACRDCSHFGSGDALDCMERLLKDALELLKEQEAKPVADIADSVDGMEVGRCPSCDRAIVNKKSDPTRYCKFCGQEVKWDA